MAFRNDLEAAQNIIQAQKQELEEYLKREKLLREDLVTLTREVKKGRRMPTEDVKWGIGLIFIAIICFALGFGSGACSCTTESPQNPRPRDQTTQVEFGTQQGLNTGRRHRLIFKIQENTLVRIEARPVSGDEDCAARIQIRERSNGFSPIVEQYGTLITELTPGNYSIRIPGGNNCSGVERLNTTVTRYTQISENSSDEE